MIVVMDGDLDEGFDSSALSGDKKWRSFFERLFRCDFLF